MEEFDPLVAPDLDTAEAIEVKEMRPKRFAHMDYIRRSDNSLLMLFRPTENSPIYFIPITSLENQYEKDMDAIRRSILLEHFDFIFDQEIKLASE